MVLFGIPFGVLVMEDLDNTLCTHCEVFWVKLLGVLRWCGHEVVRAELGWAYLLSVAVEELDGHVGSILSEEGDCLLTSLNLVAQVPHLSALLANIVGCAQLGDLIASFVLMCFNKGLELLVTKVVLSLPTHGLFLTIGFGVHDIVHFVAILVLEDLIAVHVISNMTFATHLVILSLHLGGTLFVERWKLSSIDDAGSELALFLCLPAQLEG